MNESYQQSYVTVCHEKIQWLQVENTRLRLHLEVARNLIKDLIDFGLSYGNAPLLEEAEIFLKELPE